MTKTEVAHIFSSEPIVPTLHQTRGPSTSKHQHNLLISSSKPFWQPALAPLIMPWKMLRSFRTLSQIRSPILHRNISTDLNDLRQRSVVSSFICTSPDSSTGLTFALFKRSQNQSTYPGKWAVCSGSIEPTDASPEAAARREIFEETNLSESDLALLRRGKPFSLKDEALKTVWTIHPFAWQLRPDAKEISLDAEHTQYKFIKPKDLSRYDHVAQLELGMKRVMVSSEMERGLEKLRNDLCSHDDELILKPLKILLAMLEWERCELRAFTNPQELWKELRWRVWHLAKNGSPDMGMAVEADLFHLLDRVNQILNPSSDGFEEIKSMSSDDVRTAAARCVKDRIKQKKEYGKRWPDVFGDSEKLSAAAAAEREERLFGDL